MIAGLVSRALDRGALAFLATLAAIGVLVPVLNLVVPATSPFHLSSYFVALFGKYGISSIPSTFLLDREGKIIAKNLRGEALGAEVAKALDSK